MSDRVVAALGRGVVPADEPLLRADDLGVLRGDGVFETMHVRGGQPWLLEAHLARMARSADQLTLALPETSRLAELARTACAAWSGAGEGALRLVCTRGPEHRDEVTVYATVGPVPAAMRGLRRDGVSVLTANLGRRAAAQPDAPWQLGGAKSLSYAVNMASQRWAHSKGADDVLWVSTDGYALEGPTSSLLWAESDLLCTVPPAQTGILAGITVGWVLDSAGELGFAAAAERMVRPEALVTADGVWLVSSLRGCVPVRTIDGAALRSSPHTQAIQDLLAHPR